MVGKESNHIRFVIDNTDFLISSVAQRDRVSLPMKIGMEKL